uniref:hypothetical protein n=1 Tax=uncultured Sphingomonas sp. TaxID=158754 RepID=UPI0035CA56AB
MIDPDLADAIRFWVVIAIGSLIGLLGAYFREQHEGRSPDRKWVAQRLGIMPFLALAASAVADLFKLSTQVALFISALFSMLAYDLVRVIALRTLKKVAGELDSIKLPSDVTVEVPAGSGKPEVVTVQATPAPPARAELRKAFPAKAERDPEIDRLIDKLGDPEL